MTLMDGTSMAADAGRILVVEDEAGMRLLLETLLEAEGHKVEVADSGEAALELLRARDYQLLVTDLRMPGLDGMELIRQARAWHPELPVIMVTGYATVDNAVLALRRGVNDYLTKPFDIQDLRRSVARALEERRLREQTTRVLAHLRQTNTELLLARNQLEEEMASTERKFSTLNSVLEKHQRKLDTLSDLSQALTSTLDLDQLLANCLELVAVEMGVEQASVMLAEPSAVALPAGTPAAVRPLTDAAPDRGESAAGAGVAVGGEDGGMDLVVKASIGPAGAEILGERLRFGEGIAGWVARERKPLLVEDVNAAPLVQALRPRGTGRDGWTPRRRQYKTASLACVPLLAKGRVLGVINVNDKANGHPFTPDDVSLLSTIAGQVAVTIENARLYDQLRGNAFRTVQALVVTLETKDAYTSGHSQRVTDYANAIGRQLSLPAGDLSLLRYAAQLHDIGKIGITEDILHKPGPLDAGEWQVIRSHPVVSERIIQPLDFLATIKGVVRHHHERWDGRGYPDGLKGANIPLLVRILGVADSYDAMTSPRPYRRRPLNHSEAMSEIARSVGTQFDPQVVAALGTGDLFVGAAGAA
jgi:response regulator RpfG family c-di-GMP phosphodiesterase